MKPKRKKNEFDTDEYRKLVSDLQNIIKEAAAKGIDLNERSDILECRSCGAHEDDGPKIGWHIRDKNGNLISKEKFIIIDKKERSYHRKKTKITYYKITYTFICSECGAYQQEVIKEQFEN